MATLILIGIVVMVAGFLFAAALAWKTRRRESRVAASGDAGIGPWFDGGGGGGACDSSGAADGGCGDGGGGGGAGGE